MISVFFRDKFSHEICMFDFQIVQAATEGLAFLERRKAFWQMQEPVFARKLRTATGNFVTLN